jgi:hypothetical protein
MAERTARNFVNVADKFGNKSTTVGDLPPSILYALAAPSTPDEVREEVVERVERGEKVTSRRVLLPVKGRKTKSPGPPGDGAAGARPERVVDIQGARRHRPGPVSPSTTSEPGGAGCGDFCGDSLFHSVRQGAIPFSFAGQRHLVWLVETSIKYGV